MRTALSLTADMETRNNAIIIKRLLIKIIPQDIQNMIISHFNDDLDRLVTRIDTIFEHRHLSEPQSSHKSNAQSKKIEQLQSQIQNLTQAMHKSFDRPKQVQNTPRPTYTNRFNNQPNSAQPQNPRYSSNTERFNNRGQNGTFFPRASQYQTAPKEPGNAEQGKRPLQH